MEINHLIEDREVDPHIGFAACPCQEESQTNSQHVLAESDQSEASYCGPPSEDHSESSPNVIREMHEDEIAQKDADEEDHLVS